MGDLYKRSQQFIHDLPRAAVYQEAITDDTGRPVDYRVVDVSREFQRISGLERDELVGQRITEVFPGLEDSRFDWFGTFARVALGGETVTFEQYFEPLGRHFQGTAYPDSDGRFYVLFRDITGDQEIRERVKELNLLHDFARLLRHGRDDLETILEQTVQLLPGAFQRPEEAVARISFRGKRYQSRGYRPTNWKVYAELEVDGESAGCIEVCCLAAQPRGQGAFLPEEKAMLETLAELLSRVIEQIKTKRVVKEKENNLSITLDSIGDGVIATDTRGLITRINRQAQHLTGWTQNEALGRPLDEVFRLINAGTGAPVPNPVARVMATGLQAELARNTVLVASDGIQRHISDSAAPVREEDGELVGVVMVFSDITERQRSEEKLRSLEWMLDPEKAGELRETGAEAEPEYGSLTELNTRRLILDSIGEDVLADIANDYLGLLETSTAIYERNGDYALGIFSSGWCRFLDAASRRLCGTSDNREALRSGKWLCHESCWTECARPAIDSGEPVDVECHGGLNLYTVPIWANGEVVGAINFGYGDPPQDRERLEEIAEKYQVSVEELLQHARSYRSRPPFMVNLAKDRLHRSARLIGALVERSRAEARVRYMSFHDSLTGLYNRYFMEEEMQRLDTGRQLPISIVVADLNGLKLVNDTYGHATGDEMLRAVARILERSCRKEDIVARYGGDEFAMLLPQTADSGARAVCQRIKERCRTARVENVPISMAVGMSVKEDAGLDLFDTLREAEGDMYRQKLAENRSEKSAVLNALLRTMATKSFETEQHSQYMQDWALRIGEKLELPDSELSRLKLLIVLHDIGKITIPEGVLTKSDPLAADEWELMKRHPETGFRIARATEEFAHVAEDILAHHERWDGEGYPRGLRGEQIPLLARITAIVDAYEVMSNGRPYKRAMSSEEVVAELRRCAGTQFDPELVETFLSVLEHE